MAADACSPRARQALLRQLADQLPGVGLLSGRQLRHLPGERLWCGLLPGVEASGGLLSEWLVDGPGAGAVALVAAVMDRAAAERGWVVVDAGGEFYLPGVPPPVEAAASLVLVRPQTAADAVWCVEQALRCRGVGQTWAWIDHTPERVLRRWKLAAEAGGGNGVLFRPARVRREPAWVDVRWLVSPRPTPQAAVRRWRLELLYCRGDLGGQQFDLELDHATGDVRVVPPLAGAAPVRAAAGA